MRSNTTFDNISKDLAETTRRVLGTLDKRSQLILALLFGLGHGQSHSYEEVAEALGTSSDEVLEIEAAALRRLRLPSVLEARSFEEVFQPPVELKSVIETVDKLTPELISHLKAHHEDLHKMPPDLFEHLVAEVFKSRGYDDVRLVGRDKNTSADIYAAHIKDPLGTRLPFFVEVKRVKRAIGTEVINKVEGAFLAEKKDFGWYGAIIVSLGGFKKKMRYSNVQLALRNIQLKDKEDLLRWLEEYEQAPGGLWLPSPQKKAPKE